MKNKASLLLAIVCAILIVVIYTKSRPTANKEDVSMAVDAVAPIDENSEENISVAPETEVYDSVLPTEIVEPQLEVNEIVIPPNPSGIVSSSTGTPSVTSQQIMKSQLLVNCNKEMIEGNEYNILACIFQEDLKDQIVKEIAESKQMSTVEVEKNSKVKSVTTTDHFSVTIVYDKTDFELLSAETSFIGSINRKKQWYEWIVKPISTGSNKQISITVENIDEDGNKYALIPAERIKIDVEVDKSGFVDNMWIQIRDNAEWTMTVLIIPIVTYFVGLFKRRKEEEETEV